MLKEMIRKMVSEPGFMNKVQAGQLQLAGMSAQEQRALIDVMKDHKPGDNVRKSHYWY